MQTVTVEKLAYAVYNRCINNWLAFDPRSTLELAREINAGDGWHLEWSAPLGGVTVAEGVRVTDDKLVAAVELAERIAAGQA